MGAKDSQVWHSCPMYSIFVNLFTRRVGAAGSGQGDGGGRTTLT